MNSLHEISAKLIQLYRQQLDVIGAARLGEADLRQYERRQEQIERLYRELDGLSEDQFHPIK